MDYQTMALQEIARCAALAEEAYGCAPVVRVTWDLRGLTGGQCRYTGLTAHVRLNAHLAQHEGDAYLQTVAHEYAHAVVHMRRLRWAAQYGMVPRGGAWSSHGYRWAEVMRLFGKPALRCHGYTSAERVVERREYVYRCDCREHRVSIVRKRRMQAGTVYRCARCRGALRSA